jgi:riboflavin biosynthesis pyrimidine reductase
MVALGLVDRLRLVVFPRIVGPGGQEPMFSGYAETILKLITSSVLDSEILVLGYRPT